MRASSVSTGCMCVCVHMCVWVPTREEAGAGAGVGDGDVTWGRGVMSPGGRVVMSPGGGAALWAPCEARWAGTSSWEAAQGALSCPCQPPPSAGLGLLTLALCDPA